MTKRILEQNYLCLSMFSNFLEENKKNNKYFRKKCSRTTFSAKISSKMMKNWKPATPFYRKNCIFSTFLLLFQKDFCGILISAQNYIIYVKMKEKKIGKATFCFFQYFKRLKKYS